MAFKRKQSGLSLDGLQPQMTSRPSAVKKGTYAKQEKTAAPSSQASRKRATKDAPAGARRKSVKAKTQASEAKAERKAARQAAKQASSSERAGGRSRSSRAPLEGGRSSSRSLQQPSEEQMRAGGARRVSDKRSRERADRNRKRYRSYVLRFIITVAAVVAIIFGGIFVYRSDLLAVRNVNVTGVSHLTNQEITQLAAVPDSSTLLRLDTAGITERLKTHPWIQSVSIHRSFPDSITIDITERTPAAVVKLSDKSIWVVSTDGAWLSAATKDDWKSNHKIIDVSSTLESPVAGSDCNDEGIENAIAVYDGISDKLAKKVKNISAESAAKTTLTLKGGVTVAFGEASDLDLKEADIWALLDEYDGTVSYINVRVPSRPTYRTL